MVDCLSQSLMAGEIEGFCEKLVAIEVSSC
jgi:hypothetical protein